MIKTIRVGDGPTDIKLNRRTNKLYVANNKIIANVQVGLSTLSGVVNEKNNRVYMANQGENTISVIAG